uniref:Poly [ADP-ribose] polymerase n=1 Tax=Periophthalmus magnuspinnatus TaxID=409849 RepID=A0A3B4BB05_9GOBI
VWCPNMEADILKFILSSQGSVDSEELLYDLCPGPALQEMISKKEQFVSCLVNQRQKVVVRTRMKVCWTENCPGCGSLHICLWCDTCDCLFYRRGCSFSHDLNSESNMEVLREFGLEALSRTELCLLLLQSNNALLPQICYNYNNNNAGCQDDCQRLHVCQRYLHRDCSCSRTHNFSAAQPLKLLQQKHIPKHLVKALKSVYANKEALRLAFKENRSNTSDINDENTCGNISDSSGVSEKQICMFFIKGYCKNEGKGRGRVQFEMPYRWEITRGGQWTAMAENEAVEKDYCDPENNYSTSSPPVHFDTMTCGTEDVRRLSTVNSVLQPDFIHTTDWLWYWEDERGVWNQYAAVVSQQHLSDRRKSSHVTQRKKCFFPQSAGSQVYELSFRDMIQTNVQYGTVKLVRRRPRFVSAAEVQAKKKRHPNSTAVPDHWDKTQVPQIGFKRVPLQPSSGEYEEIHTLFSRTMASFEIIQIERIQNRAVWEAFQLYVFNDNLHKTHMKQKNGGRPVLEKTLFHGTKPKFVDTICEANIDWRVCGVNGTMYGQGSYFARDAKYSHSYTGDSDPRFMFVSRVLVGEFARGSSEYRRPPSRDGGDVNLFDSCVDDIYDPSIFVVFKEQQIYPEYLLKYKNARSNVYAGSRLNRD